MRILALDWGTKRIGAAISDEEEKIAFPLEQTVETKNAVSEIKDIVSKYGVGLVLLGLPRNQSGQEGSSAKFLREFADNLAAATGKPITYIDERFTTVQATKLLRQQGLSEKKQRLIKDNIAAQVILQSYLDAKYTK